jgi:hypothetical protein
VVENGVTYNARPTRRVPTGWALDPLPFVTAAEWQTIEGSRSAPAQCGAGDPRRQRLLAEGRDPRSCLRPS